MSVIKFPSNRPSASQIEAPSLQLAGLLKALTDDLTAKQHELMSFALGQGSAEQVAAIVHDTARKMAEASTGWADLSDTVRKSWGIRP